jgi:hypothetical protein
MSFDSVTDVFRMMPINGYTINCVVLPQGTIVFFYGIILVLFISTVLFYCRNGMRFAIYRAVVTTFIAGGIIYSVNTSVGWGIWLTEDWGQFGGLSTEEKLARADGALYEIAGVVKSVLSGSDKYFLLADDKKDFTTLLLNTKLEFYLLPLRNSERSKYIIVLDPYHAANYETGRKELIWNNKKYDNVDLIIRFSAGAYLLEKL